MVTPDENEFMTQTGAGTPGGELLRRYWHPIAVASELTEENPTKFVRILSENLVLFLDKKGNVGLIGDRCPHRGASLLYGRVEERGIACAYHGWLYDTQGNCLETPAEPADSKFHLTIKHKAYPVQKFVGLFWTYMGPLPAPSIPKYDVLMRKDGRRSIRIHPQVDSNWVQIIENSVDPSHLEVLHQTRVGRGRIPSNTTRGFLDDIDSYEFETTSYGIMKIRTYKDGQVDCHPVLFPNIVRVGKNAQYRVPIDDTHTAHIHIRFKPTVDGSLVEDDEDPEVTYLGPYKEPADALYPAADFSKGMKTVQGQDHMVWETQGPVTDRTKEHLASSDKGVMIYRKLLLENIRMVQRGQDPMGVMRDPNHAMIDTKLLESLAGVETGVRPIISTETKAAEPRDSHSTRGT
jgi:5,5'-dehydrodivanillate O-demethylase